MSAVDEPEGDSLDRGAELLERALELPEAEREGFVRSQCGDDPELLQRLIAFLRGKPTSKLTTSAGGIVSRVMGEGRLERIGPCVVKEMLGAGSMGTVYRARQDPPGRDVAVKVLHSVIASDARGRERFLGEGRKFARLDHPGIVHVHLLDEDQGRYYMVMEFVPGHDLGIELAALRGEGDEQRILPDCRDKGYFRAVAEVVRQAADALEHAHGHGLVHRDVKPQNLMLAPDGRVKVMDLGIARDTTEGSITRTGEIVGTPHYMSPEQASRARVRVDHRTDVYSLGVVLYELLTLRRPFDGPTSMHVLASIASDDPRLPRAINPRIDRDLEAVCIKALARDPDARYSTAAEFARDLARHIAGEAVEAPVLGWSDHALRFARRRRRVLIAAGFVVVGSVASFGAVLATTGPSRERDLARRIEAELAAQPGGERALVEDIRRAMDEGWLDREDAQAAQLVARSAEHARELVERARAGLSAVRTGRAEDFARAHTTWDDDVRAAAAAVQALREYTGQLPEDLGHEHLLPSTVGVRVRVESSSNVPARLAAQPLDVFTGRTAPARWVATTTDTDGALRASVPEGPVRFWVVQEGYGFAELQRFLQPGEKPTEVTAHIRTKQEAGAGLVSIQASKCKLSTGIQKLGAPGRDPIEYELELDAYFLESDPVANGEVARFLELRSRPLPDWWPKPVTSEWLARPATRVDHELATEYAESKGWRLPTQAEWLLAARGPAIANLPPGVDRPRLEAGAVRFGIDGPRRDLPEGPEADAEIARWMLASFPPVGHQRGVAWAAGVNDVFGPIVEWTDSWFVARTAQVLTTFENLRFLHGATTVEPLERRLTFGYGLGIMKPPDTSDSYTGFRCARSAELPAIR